MCLAVPAKIVAVKDEACATADLHGNQIDVSTVMTPDAGVGDWVLIHAGFAIQQLDQQTAMETWAVLNDLEGPSSEKAGPPP